MRLDYGLFMAEAGGFLTRSNKLRRAAECFSYLYHRGYDINDAEVQKQVFSDLDLTDLTDPEERYIMREFEKRV